MTDRCPVCCTTPRPWRARALEAEARAKVAEDEVYVTKLALDSAVEYWRTKARQLIERAEAAEADRDVAMLAHARVRADFLYTASAFPVFRSPLIKPKTMAECMAQALREIYPEHADRLLAKDS